MNAEQMMYSSSRLSVALVLALLVIPSTSSAQDVRDSVKHRNDCRLAAQILTRGQPAIRMPWALRIVPDCGATGGDAVAEVIRASPRGGVSETKLESVVMVASVLEDAGIFSAALEAAGDGAGDKAARIQALRVLFYQLCTGRIDPYESFLSTNETVYIPIADYPRTVGRPLPADAVAQAATLARQLITNHAIDSDVRAAARKLLSAVRNLPPPI